MSMADDVTVQARVTRASMGLAPLDLTDPDVTGYDILSHRVGARIWDRQMVTSPYVHGEYMVGRTLAGATNELRVEVRGRTQSDIDRRVDQLRAAFEQYEFTYEVTLSGSTGRWRCYTADIAIDDGEAVVTGLIRARRRIVSLMIPRHPVPLAGPV